MKLPGVKDAVIRQRGDQLILVLVVGYSIPEEKAKDYGVEFARLLDNVAKENWNIPSWKGLGGGRYYYSVSVFRPGRQVVSTTGRFPITLSEWRRMTGRADWVDEIPDTVWKVIIVFMALWPISIFRETH